MRLQKWQQCRQVDTHLPQFAVTLIGAKIKQNLCAVAQNKEISTIFLNSREVYYLYRLVLSPAYEPS